MFIPETFLEFAGSVLLVALSIIAVRFAITLDLVAWRKETRRQLEHKMRLSCPHAIVEYDGNDREVFHSCFVLQPGTSEYQCCLCDTKTKSVGPIQFLMQQYVENPELYYEQQSRFRRIYRKLLR